jgi:NAD(P)-dependent dehydrogenase (short-subunit alcohol dehydrogenase family)
VMAEAVRWGKRGARVNTISPGIIITPLANDELKGPRGPGYLYTHRLHARCRQFLRGSLLPQNAALQQASELRADRP